MSVSPYDATPGFTAHLQIRLGLSLHSLRQIAVRVTQEFATGCCLSQSFTKTKPNTLQAACLLATVTWCDIAQGPGTSRLRRVTLAEVP